MNGAALLLASIFAIGTGAPAPATAQVDNAELKKLFDSDQADRNGSAFRTEPGAVAARDEQRREAALEFVKDGALHSARDYFHAAMIFQHSAQNIDLAHALSTVASYLDPENKQYRWLMAASWDRMLVRRVQPQWYGTQFQSDERGIFLFPLADNAVTDAERAEMGVPPLDEARAMVIRMAAMTGEQPHPSPPTIEELQKKGRLNFGESAPPSQSGNTEE